MLIRTAAVVALAAGALSGSSALAQSVTLTANLTGGQENPPVSTPATGTATLIIDLSTNNWTLDIQFGTLTAPLSVAHIHRAPTGSNGPVIIGLDGMALSGGRPSWALLSPGITSFSSGGPLAAPFAFPAGEVSNLLAGNTYINIHSTQFPGGEIRGQLVPTPATATLLGLAGLVAARRRRN
jgi:hypothetical protein